MLTSARRLAQRRGHAAHDGQVELDDQAQLLGQPDGGRRAAAALEAGQGLVVVQGAGLEVDHRLVDQLEAARLQQVLEARQLGDGLAQRRLEALGGGGRAFLDAAVQRIADGAQALARVEGSSASSEAVTLSPAARPPPAPAR